MFGSSSKKNSSNSTPNSTGVNIINFNTKIEGKLTINNDLRLDGEVEGDITGSGKIVIGEKGVVKGTLTCDNAEISGKVDGNIIVKETLTVRSQAIINGDIRIKTLVVEPNAVINGNCTMQSVNPFSEKESKKSK